MPKPKELRTIEHSGQETYAWLEMSRHIANSVNSCMKRENLDRNDIARKLGVSVQYVSRLLSGTANLSLKSVARLDAVLGIRCFNMNENN